MTDDLEPVAGSLEPRLPLPDGRELRGATEPLPWDEPSRHRPGVAAPARAALARTRLLHWAVVAALVAGPLLAAEAGVRLLIATGRLPVAAAHLADVEIMWSNLARLPRPPDLLLLGDSLTQQGIDPATLERLVATADGGRRVIAFDAASSSGGFGVNAAFVEELAREGRLPRVAVVGVSASSLASDATFREVFAPTPMGGLFTRCALADGYDRAIDCRFGELSALWRWRGSPERVVGAAVRPTPRTAERQGFLLRSDGFREGPPATVATLRDQLPTALDREPPRFALGADVPEAYEWLIGALRAAGVGVVPVVVPYSPVLVEALEARRPGWDADRAAAVGALAAATGVPVVDPGSYGSWWGDGSSRDVKHLSRDGAPRFTEQLWAIDAFRESILAGLH